MKQKFWQQLLAAARKHGVSPRGQGALGGTNTHKRENFKFQILLAEPIRTTVAKDGQTWTRQEDGQTRAKELVFSNGKDMERPKLPR